MVFYEISSMKQRTIRYFKLLNSFDKPKRIVIWYTFSLKPILCFEYSRWEKFIKDLSTLYKQFPI